MAEKKVPMRTCIACRQIDDKKNLIRVVKSKDGEISLDKTGKKAGRGAYVCNDIKCIQKLKKGKILNKVFSMEIPDEVYTAVEEDFID